MKISLAVAILAEGVVLAGTTAGELSHTEATQERVLGLALGHV